MFGPFSWLFRGPRFGQNLRVLALEQSSDNKLCSFGIITKIVPPKDFLCRVAATGVSLFAKEHAKESDL